MCTTDGERAADNSIETAPVIGAHRYLATVTDIRENTKSLNVKELNADISIPGTCTYLVWTGAFGSSLMSMVATTDMPGARRLAIG